MEYRMYCLVERHLSSIQKAIQSAHAIVEYGLTYGDTPEYKQWAEKYKTIIVLDGGNSRDLDNAADVLNYEKIPFAIFEEPDMLNFKTSICFLADERVFDYETYGRNYNDFVMKSSMIGYTPDSEEKWIELIGGYSNAILKQIVAGKKIAI